MSKGRRLHNDPEWLYERYYVDRLDTYEMAELADVSPRTIQRSMDRHGIDRIPMGPKVIPPKMWTDVHGYELVEDRSGRVRVSRLLAISEYGFDAVCGNEVHHKNGIPWDDRPDNIELLTKEDHARHHALKSRFWKYREGING